MMNRRKFGFTLIEMLIVIVVIAILVLIVIPRLLNSIRLGRESELRWKLRDLRTGIVEYKKDCGEYPPTLVGLIEVPNNSPEMARRWKGSYVVWEDDGLPRDPFTGKRDWDYNPKTGAMHSRSNLNTLATDLGKEHKTLHDL